MKNFLLLPLLLFANFAVADECDFRLSLPTGYIEVSDTAQVVEQEFTIERRENANGPCSRYRLYFSKGLANSYQRRAFNFYLQSTNYNLHQNVNLTGILKERNDALNSSEYVSGNTPDDDREYTNRFFLAVPAISSQTNQRAGLFYDIVQVAIYRVHSNDFEAFERNYNYSVYINVPYEVNVSIVNEGDPFNINATSKVLDFGVLEENKVLGADIIVDSNTSYQLRMSSLNDGKLMSGASNINYQLSVNNSNVNLSGSSSSPVTIGTGSGPTPASGTRYNTKVRILSLPNNPASGVYTDSITITAIAN